MKRLKIMKQALMFLKILILVCAVLNVCACGKISDPKPIEKSGYPHSYPRI